MATQSKAGSTGVWVNGVGRFETSHGVSWRIRYRAPVHPTSTVTRQVTETLRYCGSRKDAEGVLAKRRTEIFEGTYRPRNSAKPVTVAEMVETFLEARKSELRGWRTYAGSLRNHVVKLLGKRYLFELTTSMCEDYRRDRLAEGAAPATVRGELRCLQGVYLEARKRELVSHDPVADMRFRGIDNARTRVPTDVEVANLAGAAQQTDTFMRPLFFVLLGTGMRLGSALALRWEDVDFANGWIEATQKGGRKVRPPMSALLAQELLLWRPASEKKGKGSGWVFPSRMRKHLTQTAVHEAWPLLLAKAKVTTKLLRHDLRRYMVTRLRALGLDDRAIGAVSGHSTVPMIDRYDRGAHERAAVEIDRVFDLKTIPVDEAEPNQSAAHLDKKALVIDK